MSTCRADGVLLKPDRPAFPPNSFFLRHRGKGEVQACRASGGGRLNALGATHPRTARALRRVRAERGHHVRDRAAVVRVRRAQVLAAPTVDEPGLAARARPVNQIQAMGG